VVCFDVVVVVVVAAAVVVVVIIWLSDFPNKQYCLKITSEILYEEGDIWCVWCENINVCDGGKRCGVSVWCDIKKLFFNDNRAQKKKKKK